MDEVVTIPAREVEKTSIDLVFANVTTFGQKVKRWIRQTQLRPDGFAFVETHIPDTEIGNASRFLRKEGYISSFQGAKLTQNGGTSGGLF